MSAALAVGTPEIVAPQARAWSPMQEAIFAAVEDPAGGNLVIEALAGTGKSTTIEECVRRTDADSSVLVCAFNSAIAKALAPRMPEGVVVQTIHAFGMRALAAATAGSLDVQKFAVSDLCKELMGCDWGSREARTAVTKLVGVAKGQAFDARNPGSDWRLLDAYADEYAIDFPKGWDRARLCGVALQILRMQQKSRGHVIDFDDMIWLPLVREISIPTFDFVFVDETQDLNPAQLEIIKLAGQGGRIIAVGDRRQAIYGFRGADSQAMPRMVEELAARTLPLSVTYRCPLAVVRCAQKFVPDLEARPCAPEGIVRAATSAELEEDAQPGDFVLSRTNAPLVSLAFRWIAAGRHARIQGRDIGAGLATWVKAQDVAAGTIGMANLRKKIDAWATAELARLEAAERDTQAVVDKAACLMALAANCADVGSMLVRIETLFADSGLASAITLSSTHRAKGLEAERVWLLRDTYLKWNGLEEENLLYVGITRSKHELIFVTDCG